MGERLAREVAPFLPVPIGESPSAASDCDDYENRPLREQSKGRSFAQFQRQYAREAEFLRSKNRCGIVFA